MSSPAILHHAARVLATIEPGLPADSALRRYLAGARRLQPAERRAISGAVFASFRWRQWLDPRESPAKQVGRALELDERFRRVAARSGLSRPDFDAIVARQMPPDVAAAPTPPEPSVAAPTPQPTQVEPTPPTAAAESKPPAAAAAESKPTAAAAARHRFRVPRAKPRSDLRNRMR